MRTADPSWRTMGPRPRRPRPQPIHRTRTPGMQPRHHRATSRPATETSDTMVIDDRGPLTCENARPFWPGPHPPLTRCSQIFSLSRS
jgi:hypothetical protein